MNPLHWSFRTHCLLAFIACFSLVGLAVWLQEARGLMPCSFCILQRIAFAATGAVFLVAGLHAPRSPAGRRTYGALAAVAALVGAGIAARHVWVQIYPPPQSMCGGGLEFLAAVNGWSGAIRKVLTASGDCSNVEYFMGMSIPMWALLWFAAFAAWALRAGFRREQGR